MIARLFCNIITGYSPTLTICPDHLRKRTSRPTCLEPSVWTIRNFRIVADSASSLSPYICILMKTKNIATVKQELIYSSASFSGQANFSSNSGSPTVLPVLAHSTNCCLNSSVWSLCDNQNRMILHRKRLSQNEIFLQHAVHLWLISQPYVVKSLCFATALFPWVDLRGVEPLSRNQSPVLLRA